MKRCNIGSWIACCVWLGLFACGTDARAQARPSVVTMWGGYAADSRGRDDVFVEVNAAADVSAVHTASGRIFVNGGNRYAVADVPALPAGRYYVQMDVTKTGGAAIRDDGELVVWGTDYHPNYLPAGIISFPPAPQLPPGVTYTDVSAGDYHILAMRSDGQFVAWGMNNLGQCNIPSLGPGQSIVSFQARSNTNYLILNDGSAVVFGDVQGGQAIPPALPSGVGYVSIAEGYWHWLGLRTDGQVVAWGGNSHGECNVPALPPGTYYTAVAGGSGHSHAARSDGVIVSWGELWGLPIPPSPVLPPGVQCLQMDCGTHHMIAVLSNGRVVTWGLNWFFESYVPSLIEEQGASPTPLRFADVSVGKQAGLAALSDGRLVGWGNAWMPSAALTANRVFTRVEYGYWHHTALTDTGEVVAWGDNSYGKATIPPLPPGTRYIDFDCSTQNTVLLRSDGEALVIGSNSDGQLNVPALPPGLRYTKCRTHERRTVLLRSDGEVFSFGRWTFPDPNVVPPLPPGLVYTDIAASKWFNTALRSDGTAVMFGGTSPSLPTWRPVPTLPFGVYFVEINGGDNHVVCRRSDGRVEVIGRVYLTFNSPPEPDPGTSYLQVSGGYELIAGRIGRASTYVGIAPGCAGSRSATRLIPRDTPKIGRTLEVTLFDLPHDLALLAMSFQQLPQPVSLAPIGMPGCDLHIGLDALIGLSGQGGQATWSLPVPDQPTLLGVTFYNQALVLDLQAGNGFGAVVSDTMRGVVGER